MSAAVPRQPVVGPSHATWTAPSARPIGTNASEAPKAANFTELAAADIVVNHDGIVYEQDRGPKSVELFRALERFDPDSTWTPVMSPDGV